jgi:hypothetical protein
MAHDNDVLAGVIARAVEDVPGVVEVYPTVAARISRGVLGTVENVAAGLQGKSGVSPLTPSLVSVSGEGSDQRIDVHIGTDATVATPDVARAVYDVVAALAHAEATIEVQVSRIEWPIVAATESPLRAASVDVAESVAASPVTTTDRSGAGHITAAIDSGTKPGA